MRHGIPGLFGVIVSSLLLAPATPAAAQQPDTQLTQNLKKLSIEELTQLDITTASRRVEPLAQVAAAVSVLRGEDLRRAGVTSLAEALRLAPTDLGRARRQRTCAISARGFNILDREQDARADRRPHRLLAALLPAPSGQRQDVLLADIDRIEVIRGPGGAVWGANAVNGVINIITKSAADTTGVQVLLGGGTEERRDRDSRNTASRARVRLSRLRQVARAGRRRPVGWSGCRRRGEVRPGRFPHRVKGRSRDSWLVQGDAYGGREGLTINPDTHVDGGNVMGRWARRFSPTSNFKAQVYFDHIYRRVYAQLHDVRNTIDVDAQQQLIAGRHDLLFGGDFRVSKGTRPAMHRSISIRRARSTPSAACSRRISWRSSPGGSR